MEITLSIRNGTCFSSINIKFDAYIGERNRLISLCRAMKKEPLAWLASAKSKRHPSFKGCLLRFLYSGPGESGGGGVGGKGQKSQNAEYAAQAGNVIPSIRLATANTSCG